MVSRTKGGQRRCDTTMIHNSAECFKVFLYCMEQSTCCFSDQSQQSVCPPQSQVSSPSVLPSPRSAVRLSSPVPGQQSVCPPQSQVSSPSVLPSPRSAVRLSSTVPGQQSVCPLQSQVSSPSVLPSSRSAVRLSFPVPDQQSVCPSQSQISSPSVLPSPRSAIRLSSPAPGQQSVYPPQFQVSSPSVLPSTRSAVRLSSPHQVSSRGSVACAIPTEPLRVYELSITGTCHRWRRPVEAGARGSRGVLVRDAGDTWVRREPTHRQEITTRRPEQSTGTAGPGTIYGQPIFQ